jgi:hypothetical protein
LLALGETVLKGRFTPLIFLLYWLACLGLTLIAAVAAFLDVKSLRQTSRDEQEKLFQSTVNSIQAEAQSRAQAKGGNPEAK